MSGTFQTHLVSKKWEKEKLLGGNSLTEAEKKEQAIDAYKEFKFRDSSFTLSRESFLKLTDELWKQGEASKERPEFLVLIMGIAEGICFLSKVGGIAKSTVQKISREGTHSQGRS